MKTILFTFDYELFLGKKSGQAIEAIIRPTDRILELFSDYAFKLIFFVDTTYLLRLQKISPLHHQAACDLHLICDQIKKIVKSGHYIFPHIHPHWLDAIYLPELNEWDLSDHSRYRLANLSEYDRQILFSESIKTLKDIAGTGLHHPIDAYRAGGWSIQPFLDFKPYFDEWKIRHEMSVIPGKYQMSDAHKYDFSGVFQSRPYYFATDVNLPLATGPYLEWPISTIRVHRWVRWLDFKISGLIQKVKGRARYAGSTVSSIILSEGDSLAAPGYHRLLASLEGLNPLRIQMYLNSIHAEEYFHFISHPKMLSEYDLLMTKSLCKKISKLNDINYDFHQFQNSH